MSLSHFPLLPCSYKTCFDRLTKCNEIEKVNCVQTKGEQRQQYATVNYLEEITVGIVRIHNTHL